MRALTLPPGPADSPVFFVRCELLGADGTVLAENTYWQSQIPDDVGPPENDAAFDSRQISWADMTALNTMARATLEVTAHLDGTAPDGSREITIRMHNPTEHLGFFQRAEVLATRDGDEILPIEYDDNYVTVFPGEWDEIHARVPAGDAAPSWVRVTGYGAASVIVAVN